MQPAAQLDKRYSDTSRLKKEDPSAYKPDEGLVDAIEAAEILGKPLFVTGEPGTGKTQLASYLVYRLAQTGLSNPVLGPFVFEAKSNSVAKDLFYTYDTLGRFQARQLEIGSTASADYVTYNALGLAILNAHPRELVERWLPTGFRHIGPRRSVVLIDEIDKAPRDFPNDILNEIDNMYFVVHELRREEVPSAPSDHYPFIVITSNSEKNLPPAFLRRCIYYNIPFPPRTKLMEIVCDRIRELAGCREPFLRSALEFVDLLRASHSGLVKKPATAELLDWLNYARLKRIDLSTHLQEQAGFLEQSLSILVKNDADRENARQIIDSWAKKT
jgi:MoxR-like ATPase